MSVSSCSTGTEGVVNLSKAIGMWGSTSTVCTYEDMHYVFWGQLQFKRYDGKQIVMEN